jgi:hypothetical protein
LQCQCCCWCRCVQGLLATEEPCIWRKDTANALLLASSQQRTGTQQLIQVKAFRALQVEAFTALQMQIQSNID